MIVKPIKNDFNLYKNFYYAAKVGSISLAAKELYISQPTVSYNIKKLESFLDCKLFYRNSKGIKLTEDGKSVLEYIEKAYNSILLAERSITNNKNLQAGSLNIGGPSHVVNGYLINPLVEFCKRYPNIKIGIITKSTKELTTYLNNNKIDLLIDTLPIVGLGEDVISKILWKKKTCFAGNKEIIEKYKKDKNSVCFIFPDLNSEIGKELTKKIMLTSETFKYQIQASSTEVMLNLCKKGIGIGYFMMDYISEELQNNELFVIEPKIEMPQIDIACCYIKYYLKHTAREFLKMLNIEI